jgi:ADP-ribose pyrophosphatase YjhB (NUDIX family)
MCTTVSMIEPESLQVHQITWLEQVDAYVRREPAEADSAALFSDFMRQHHDAARRELSEGHLTGSAWLVSADGERILLTHHRKLGLWLQLGGHADGDPDLAQVALRAAEEESGLTDLVVRPEVFDIDRHWIPERGDVAGHWHYDMRYVVQCQGSEAFAVSEESLALAWRNVAQVAQDDGVDASVRRMACKWLRERNSAML